MTASQPVTMESDVVSLLYTVARAWRRLAVGAAIGALIGGGIVLVVPARFTAQALVLIRTASDPTAALASKAGPLAELAPSALGAGFKDELETELALLKSRAVSAVVVDRLHLQLRVRTPTRATALSLADSVRTTGRFVPYTVTLKPGRNTVKSGTVWLRADAPAAVTVKLMDRDDAIDDVIDHLDVKKEGGEVVRVTYTGPDSLTSAEVPNLAIATYLERRRTVDRGLNQRRFEFMSGASDSVNRDLVDAVGARRDLQERTQVPMIESAIKAVVEQAAALESSVGTLRAEEMALDSVLRTARNPRQLATVPALLRSPLMNELVGQLAQLEERRAMLVATLPSTAPTVLAVNAARDSIASQLVPLAQTYLQSLTLSRRSMERELTGVRARLNALPGAGQSLFMVETRLARLGVMANGLGTQVLQARLAALSEGGDVRIVDAAVPPRKITFPRPALTVVGAALLGLLAALALVLVSPAPSARPPV